MSFMTAINNFRTTRKIEKEKNNAGQAAPPRASSTGLHIFVVPFALAFVFMLMALAAPPMSDQPHGYHRCDRRVRRHHRTDPHPRDRNRAALVLMQILGFIMGLLAAILAMIKFQH